MSGTRILAAEIRMIQTQGLLLVLMEPPAPLEEEFNDWYDTEHFPQRRALPGFASASRWVCLSGWPRWAALYDVESVAVFDSAEYRAVSGTNSTPWSRRILPRTMGRTRLVLQQLASGTAPSLPPGDVVSLVLARYRESVAAQACLDVAGTLPGCRQARVFRTEQEPEQTVLIVELDRPADAVAVHAALGVIAGVGAMLLNVYAPYWRG